MKFNNLNHDMHSFKQERKIETDNLFLGTFW